MKEPEQVYAPDAFALKYKEFDETELFRKTHIWYDYGFEDIADVLAEHHFQEEDDNPYPETDEDWDKFKKFLNIQKGYADAHFSVKELIDICVKNNKSPENVFIVEDTDHNEMEAPRYQIIKIVERLPANKKKLKEEYDKKYAEYLEKKKQYDKNKKEYDAWKKQEDIKECENRLNKLKGNKNGK